MTQNKPTGSFPRSLNQSNTREAPQNISHGAAENTSPYFLNSAFLQEDKSLSFRDENSSFQEYQPKFQGDQSAFQNNQPSTQDDPLNPLMFHEGHPSFQDAQPSFQEDQHIIQEDFNGVEQNVSSDDEESPDRSTSFLLSEKLGSLASELKDEVMTMQPSIQKQENQDKSIITSAQKILRDAIDYREKLDAQKEQYAARLGQVSNALALKKSNT